MLRFVKRHSEYQEFLLSGRLIRSRYFTVPILEGCTSETAAGITISKRIGKAVVRNLLKRRIKAWLRKQCTLLPSGLRLVLIARSGAGELSWQELCTELETILSDLTKPQKEGQL